jgi:hypothetical protein
VINDGADANEQVAISRRGQARIAIDDVLSLAARRAHELPLGLQRLRSDRYRTPRDRLDHAGLAFGKRVAPPAIAAPARFGDPWQVTSTIERDLAAAGAAAR